MFDAEAGALQRVRARVAQEADLIEIRGRFENPFDVAAAITVVRASANADPAVATDQELLDTAEELEHLRRLLDATQLVVLGELEHRSTTDVDRGLHTRSWLARTSQLPQGVARRRVRLGEQLRSMPDSVGAALAAGELGEQHVGVLAEALANPRALDAFAGLIDDLVDQAQTLSFDVWRRLVATTVALLDQDGPEPDDLRPQDDTVSLTQGFAGTWTLRGQFTNQTGQIIHQALNDAADRLFHQRNRDQDHAPDLVAPARRHLLAQALLDLARADHARTGGTRRAPAAEVLLHLDAADPTRLRDDQGFPIGDTSRLTLLCDPTLRCVVFDMDRTVLDLGHEQRLASAAQRRSLAERDGGCVFPGCDAPPNWCDAHHIRHWLHGGATGLGNLALLCRYHHGVTHRTGWTTGITDDQWCWWRTPNGHAFWSQRHGQPRAGPAPAV